MDKTEHIRRVKAHARAKLSRHVGDVNRQMHECQKTVFRRANERRARWYREHPFLSIWFQPPKDEDEERWRRPDFSAIRKMDRRTIRFYLKLAEMDVREAELLADCCKRTKLANEERAMTGERDLPKVITWMGRPISALTRDELMDALKHMVDLVESERASRQSERDLMRAISKARKG